MTDTLSPAPAVVNPLAATPASAPAATPAAMPAVDNPLAKPPAAEDWVAGLDDEGRQLVQQKGWKTVADLAQGYKNLERFMGGDKMPVPKSEDDPAWAVVRKALGVPESPDKYEIKPLDSPAFNKDLFDGLKTVAHKNNIPAKALENIYTWYNDMAAKNETTLVEQYNQQLATETTDLKKAWAADYDTNLNISKSALNQLKVSSAERDALVTALGVRRAAEIFNQVGKALGANQSSINTVDNKPQPMLAELKANPDFAAKFAKGDPEARKQWLAALNRNTSS